MTKTNEFKIFFEQLQKFLHSEQGKEFVAKTETSIDFAQQITKAVIESEAITLFMRQRQKLADYLNSEEVQNFLKSEQFITMLHNIKILAEPSETIKSLREELFILQNQISFYKTSKNEIYKKFLPLLLELEELYKKEIETLKSEK